MPTLSQFNALCDAMIEYHGGRRLVESKYVEKLKEERIVIEEEIAEFESRGSRGRGWNGSYGRYDGLMVLLRWAENRVKYHEGEIEKWKAVLMG